jgi:hypothetical protein
MCDTVGRDHSPVSTCCKSCPYALSARAREEVPNTTASFPNPTKWQFTTFVIFFMHASRRYESARGVVRYNTPAPPPREQHAYAVRSPRGSRDAKICWLLFSIRTPFIRTWFEVGRGVQRYTAPDQSVNLMRRRRCSGVFYKPFLSRNRGIQFYGFCVRAVQDSWFAMHARIACMTDGQSARRLAWNTACDPHAY